MKIVKVRVSNYKSIVDSGWLSFDAGINTLIGKNNSGKTAFLEALTLSYTSVPHRSPASMPDEGVYNRAPSIVGVQAEVPASLLRQALQVDSQFLMPRPAEEPDAALEAFAAMLRSQGSIRVSYSVNGTHIQHQDDHRDEWSFRAYAVSKEPAGAGQIWAMRLVASGANIGFDGGRAYSGATIHNLLYQRVYQHVERAVYRFSAQRYGVATCRFGSSPILKQDASNLAEVLNALQGRNPSRMKKLIALVRTVFPDVRGISVEPVGDGDLRILVWPVEFDTGRQDLAVSLSDCGAGVGQVLAILYVVVASPGGRIILIDEPLSFLHPGAARKLIEILYAHPEHQYFIATHQPIGLLATGSQTVHHVSRTELITSFEAVSGTSAAHLRAVLDGLGVKPSDLFGVDRVIWVEGPTEEDCFELIVGARMHQHAGTTKFLAVRAPDEVLGDKAVLVQRVYRRITDLGGVMPRTVAIVFDRELRIDEEMVSVRRAAPVDIHFLPRRMFESYLMQVGPICSVLNLEFVRVGIDLVLDDVAVVGAISRAVEQQPRRERSNPNAGRVLDRVFRDLSGERLGYDKIRHGRMLVIENLAQDPSVFDELVAFLEPMLG